MDALSVRNPETLSYVTQTTLSVDDTAIVIDALRRRYPLIQGPRKDDICYATQNRQDAVKQLAGECDLAIANTYYMGKMITNEKDTEQKDWAQDTRIMFPSSPEIGTHVNISGMLLAKNAPHRDNAIKLMTFLASDEAQRLYANGNYEYPVNPAVPASEIVQSWGKFTPDTLNVAEIARLEKTASKLVDEVQFND